MCYIDNLSIDALACYIYLFTVENTAIYLIGSIFIDQILYCKYYLMYINYLIVSII